MCFRERPRTLSDIRLLPSGPLGNRKRFEEPTTIGEEAAAEWGANEVVVELSGP